MSDETFINNLTARLDELKEGIPEDLSELTPLQQEVFEALVDVFKYSFTAFGESNYGCCQEICEAKVCWDTPTDYRAPALAEKVAYLVSMSNIGIEKVPTQREITRWWHSPENDFTKVLLSQFGVTASDDAFSALGLDSPALDNTEELIFGLIALVVFVVFGDPVLALHNTGYLLSKENIDNILNNLLSQLSEEEIYDWTVQLDSLNESITEDIDDEAAAAQLRIDQEAVYQVIGWIFGKLQSTLNQTVDLKGEDSDECPDHDHGISFPSWPGLLWILVNSILALVGSVLIAALVKKKFGVDEDGDPILTPPFGLKDVDAPDTYDPLFSDALSPFSGFKISSVEVPVENIEGVVVTSGPIVVKFNENVMDEDMNFKDLSVGEAINYSLHLSANDSSPHQFQITGHGSDRDKILITPDTPPVQEGDYGVNWVWKFKHDPGSSDAEDGPVQENIYNESSEIDPCTVWTDDWKPGGSHRDVQGVMEGDEGVSEPSVGEQLSWLLDDGNFAEGTDGISLAVSYLLDWYDRNYSPELNEAYSLLQSIGWLNGKGSDFAGFLHPDSLCLPRIEEAICEFFIEADSDNTPRPKLTIENGGGIFPCLSDGDILWHGNCSVGDSSEGSVDLGDVAFFTRNNLGEFSYRPIDDDYQQVHLAVHPCQENGEDGEPCISANFYNLIIEGSENEESGPFCLMGWEYSSQGDLMLDEGEPNNGAAPVVLRYNAAVIVIQRNGDVVVDGVKVARLSLLSTTFTPGNDPVEYMIHPKYIGNNKIYYILQEGIHLDCEDPLSLRNELVRTGVIPNNLSGAFGEDSNCCDNPDLPDELEIGDCTVPTPQWLKDWYEEYRDYLQLKLPYDSRWEDDCVRYTRDEQIMLVQGIFALIDGFIDSTPLGIGFGFGDWPNMTRYLNIFPFAKKNRTSSRRFSFAGWELGDSKDNPTQDYPAVYSDDGTLEVCVECCDMTDCPDAELEYDCCECSCGRWDQDCSYSAGDIVTGLSGEACFEALVDICGGECNPRPGTPEATGTWERCTPDCSATPSAEFEITGIVGCDPECGSEGREGTTGIGVDIGVNYLGGENECNWTWRWSLFCPSEGPPKLIAEDYGPAPTTDTLSVPLPRGYCFDRGMDPKAGDDLMQNVLNLKAADPRDMYMVDGDVVKELIKTKVMKNQKRSMDMGPGECIIILEVFEPITDELVASHGEEIKLQNDPSFNLITGNPTPEDNDAYNGDEGVLYETHCSGWCWNEEDFTQEMIDAGCESKLVYPPDWFINGGGFDVDIDFCPCITMYPTATPSEQACEQTWVWAVENRLQSGQPVWVYHYAGIGKTAEPLTTIALRFTDPNPTTVCLLSFPTSCDTMIQGLLSSYTWEMGLQDYAQQVLGGKTSGDCCKVIEVVCPCSVSPGTVEILNESECTEGNNGWSVNTITLSHDSVNDCDSIYGYMWRATHIVSNVAVRKYVAGVGNAGQVTLELPNLAEGGEAVLPDSKYKLELFTTQAPIGNGDPVPDQLLWESESETTFSPCCNLTGQNLTEGDVLPLNCPVDISLAIEDKQVTEGAWWNLDVGNTDTDGAAPNNDPYLVFDNQNGGKCNGMIISVAHDPRPHHLICTDNYKYRWKINWNGTFTGGTANFPADGSWLDGLAGEPAAPLENYEVQVYDCNEFIPPQLQPMSCTVQLELQDLNGNPAPQNGMAGPFILDNSEGVYDIVPSLPDTPDWAITDDPTNGVASISDSLILQYTANVIPGDGTTVMDSLTVQTPIVDQNGNQITTASGAVDIYITHEDCPTAPTGDFTSAAGLVECTENTTEAQITLSDVNVSIEHAITQQGEDGPFVANCYPDASKVKISYTPEAMHEFIPNLWIPLWGAPKEVGIFDLVDGTHSLPSLELEVDLRDGCNQFNPIVIDQNNNIQWRPKIIWTILDSEEQPILNEFGNELRTQFIGTTQTTNAEGCYVLGCTDENANNYDPCATIDDGSCERSGCSDPNAENCLDRDSHPTPSYGFSDSVVLGEDYPGTIIADDASCIYHGCMDPVACNYDSQATFQPGGACVYQPEMGNLNVIVTNKFSSSLSIGLNSFADSDYSHEWNGNGDELTYTFNNGVDWTPAKASTILCLKPETIFTGAFTHYQFIDGANNVDGAINQAPSPADCGHSMQLAMAGNGEMDGSDNETKTFQLIAYNGDPTGVAEEDQCKKTFTLKIAGVPELILGCMESESPDACYHKSDATVHDESRCRYLSYAHNYPPGDGDDDHTWWGTYGDDAYNSNPQWNYPATVTGTLPSECITAWSTDTTSDADHWEFTMEICPFLDDSSVPWVPTTNQSTWGTPHLDKYIEIQVEYIPGQPNGACGDPDTPGFVPGTQQGCRRGLFEARRSSHPDLMLPMNYTVDKEVPSNPGNWEAVTYPDTNARQGALRILVDELEVGDNKFQFSATTDNGQGGTCEKKITIIIHRLDCEPTWQVSASGGAANNGGNTNPVFGNNDDDDVNVDVAPMGDDFGFDPN